MFRFLYSNFKTKIISAIFFLVSDKLLDYNNTNCEVDFLEREINERVNRGNRISFSGQSGRSACE